MLITFESDAVIHLINKLPTSTQRINARKKIKAMVGKTIDAEIAKHKETLRRLRSEPESAKRSVLALISGLEITKLEMESGKYGF